jgi:hypothetical protein
MPVSGGSVILWAFPTITMTDTTTQRYPTPAKIGKCPAWSLHDMRELLDKLTDPDHPATNRDLAAAYAVGLQQAKHFDALFDGSLKAAE